MKPHLIIVTITLFTSSCGLVVPLQYDKKSNENTVIRIEEDNVTVYLEHIANKFDNLVFDLEVINDGDDSISLGPQMISFYASNKPFPTVTGSKEEVQHMSALNSQLMLKKEFARSVSEVNALYNQNIKSKAAIGTFLFVVGVGLALNDAIQDSKDSRKETWTPKDERKAVLRDAVVTTALLATDVVGASLNKDTEDNNYLPHELFPDCKIEPGQRVRGKIFISGEIRYRYYRIVVPIKTTDYIFDFRRKGAKAP